MGRGILAWVQGPQRGPLLTSNLPVSFTAAYLKRVPVSMDSSHPRDGDAVSLPAPGVGFQPSRPRANLVPGSLLPERLGSLPTPTAGQLILTVGSGPTKT